MKRSVWRWYARRAAIDPIFGHLKSDNRLERNHLKGKDGDRMNDILSGCSFFAGLFLGKRASIIIKEPCIRIPARLSENFSRNDFVIFTSYQSLTVK